MLTQLLRIDNSQRHYGGFAMKSAKIWTGIGICVLAGRAMAMPFDSSADGLAARKAPLLISGAGGEGGGEGGGDVPVVAPEGLKPELKEDVVADLKRGGYVVYFRDFGTGELAADAPSSDCAAAPLDAKAAALAADIRASFAALGIPVGKVVSSPLCRATQSAALAFGKPEIVEGLKVPGGADLTEAQKLPIRKALYPLLVAAPNAGTNTVIIGHKTNPDTVAAPIPGEEGEAIVFKPDGKGGFEVEFLIEPDAWVELAKK